jgi:hypothetical protein
MALIEHTEDVAEVCGEALRLHPGLFAALFVGSVSRELRIRPANWWADARCFAQRSSQEWSIDGCMRAVGCARCATTFTRNNRMDGSVRKGVMITPSRIAVAGSCALVVSMVAANGIVQIAGRGSFSASLSEWLASRPQERWVLAFLYGLACTSEHALRLPIRGMDGLYGWLQLPLVYSGFCCLCQSRRMPSGWTCLPLVTHQRASSCLYSCP